MERFQYKMPSSNNEVVNAVNSHDALVAALGLAYEALSGMGEQTEAASAAAYEALAKYSTKQANERSGWNHLKEKYIVWVGGIDDHFKTKEEANQSAAEWKAKGYTDVIIEKSYYS